MGKRGPAPKPTALRILHGDDKGRINTNEPRPLDIPITKPTWLSEYAEEEWDRLAPHFVAMGTFKATDETALAFYCEAVARGRKLIEVVSRTPPLIKGREDTLVKNPSYSQVAVVEHSIRLLAREFGLTPAARAGIRVDVHVVDESERILTRRDSG
jgi:P27 family predicted phage terminase small subunit